MPEELIVINKRYCRVCARWTWQVLKFESGWVCLECIINTFEVELIHSNKA